MPLDLGALAQAIERFEFTDNLLNVSVGLGVIGLPAEGQTSWFVARFEGGICQELAEAVLPTDAILANELPIVDVGISGQEPIWERIRDTGEAALLSASADLDLKIAGEAPLFIARLDQFKSLLLGVWG